MRCVNLLLLTLLGVSFLPVKGGWGKAGATHIRLAEADELTLAGALHTAWKHRIQLNETAGKKKLNPRTL